MNKLTIPAERELELVSISIEAETNNKRKAKPVMLEEEDRTIINEIVDSIMASIDAEIRRIDTEIDKLKLKKEEAKKRREQRRTALSNKVLADHIIERFSQLAGIKT